MPNMTIIAPKDINEFKQAIKFASTFNGPLAIRYPKECDETFESCKIQRAKWQYLKNNDSEITIFAIGPNCNNIAMTVAEECDKKINVVNAMFVKPLDSDLLKTRLYDKKWIILEENQESGGVGQQILSFAQQFDVQPQISIVAVKDKFVKHSSINEQLVQNGFDINFIKEIILK